MTDPPGDAATAAPVSPAMKAPEAATRWLGAGGEVVTGFPVVVEPAVVAVAPGADDAVVEVSLAGGFPVVDVESSATEEVDDDAARLSPDPPEQAVAANATTSNRTRRFTDAHHRTEIRRP